MRSHLAAMSEARRGRVLILSRILGAVFVGYAFSAAWVALLSVALPVTGMARSESVILASMLGFLIYLGVLIWGFADTRLTRVWAVLAAGGVLAYTLMRVIKAWGA